jgi:hypothetical protein
MSLNDFAYVGSVWVDAGCVFVGDPCYSITSDADHQVETWSEFSDRLFDKKHEITNDVVAPFKGHLSDAPEAGLGLVISSGFGDGSYPVYVKYSDEGIWGTRVSAVIIDFLGQLGLPEV